MDGLFLTSRRHWWERVNSTLIEFRLSETSGLSGERTRAARLVDRDANDCAIPPPPIYSGRLLPGNKVSVFVESGFVIKSTYLSLF